MSWNHTKCYSPASIRELLTSSSGWKVYRVETQSSRYHLGVFEGSAEQRRYAVLRGTSSSGRDIDVEDSAPLIGGRSLFEVPVSEWPGNRLEVGSTKTSPIQGVAPETNMSIVREVTQPGIRAAAIPQQAAPSSTWAPYPEKYVEYVEQAALFLGAVYRQKTLLQDLSARPELLNRMKLALTECLLMTTGNAERMTGPH